MSVAVRRPKRLREVHLWLTIPEHERVIKAAEDWGVSQAEVLRRLVGHLPGDFANEDCAR